MKVQGDLMQAEQDDLAKVAGVVAARTKSLDYQLYSEALEGAGSTTALVACPEKLQLLPNLCRQLSSKDVIERALNQIAEWRKQDIEVVTLGEPDYPKRLATIYEPPCALFYKGRISPLSGVVASIAVVGSRKSDPQGCEIAFSFARELALRGAVVISGLAYGVDSQAHSGALAAEMPGATWAVLGGGLDLIYPASHFQLAQQIVINGGALISQFEPGAKPFPQNFLNRNRVIAGLADGVIVVQAAGRSGSLVTARFALEEGRDVMAVPGAISDPQYAGSNALIKQGAYLITSVEDILELLPQLKTDGVGGSYSGKRMKIEELESENPTEKLVLKAVRDLGAVHLDALTAKLPAIPAGEVYVAVLTLELAEKLLRLPGNLISIKPSI